MNASEKPTPGEIADRLAARAEGRIVGRAWESDQDPLAAAIADQITGAVDHLGIDWHKAWRRIFRRKPRR